MKKIRLWMLVPIILAAGLSFDGGILGFQRFGIQEVCILCYGVGGSLFLTLFAVGWSRRSQATVVLGMAVWSAAFASQALFVFPERTPDLGQTVMITFQPAQPDGKQIFFFFSLHCDKCNGVMASLAAHPPRGGKWHLIPLDTQPDDQRKLSALLDHPLAAVNPFSAILVLKNASLHILCVCSAFETLFALLSDLIQSFQTGSRGDLCRVPGWFASRTCGYIGVDTQAFVCINRLIFRHVANYKR